jgi:hypothetical protein
MVVQQGHRRDKYRRRTIPTRPAPSCLNSSIPKQGTLRILSSRERSSRNARLWAKRLSRQTQGGRVEYTPGLGG